MLRRLMLAVVMAVLTVARAAHAQQHDRDGFREPVPTTREDSDRAFWNDALTVLQGNDTVEFFSPHVVEMTANAIRDIRATYPSVRAIGVATHASLHVTTFDTAVLGALARVGRPTDTTIGYAVDILHKTGLRSLDSLNESLGVNEVRVDRLGHSAELLITFDKPANIPVVSRRYQRRLPYMEDAGLSLFGMDGDFIILMAEGPLFHFVFSAGYDDCPNGCILHDYWYFTFDTVSKSITSNGQLLGGPMRDDTVYLWDVPSNESVDMYHSIDDLLAGAASPDWWVRRHTVRAIGYLLGNRWYPYHGAPNEPNPYAPGAEATLHVSALARRRECLMALVNRLGDVTMGISGNAHVQLQEATGQQLPGGAAGQRVWRAWVEAHTAP
jgi:hypothetical protein